YALFAEAPSVVGDSVKRVPRFPVFAGSFPDAGVRRVIDARCSERICECRSFRFADEDVPKGNGRDGGNAVYFIIRNLGDIRKSVWSVAVRTWRLRLMHFDRCRRNAPHSSVAYVATRKCDAFQGWRIRSPRLSRDGVDQS